MFVGKFICKDIVSGWRSYVPSESVAELEKIYKTAIVGSEEERPAAASILCGASLIRSWTVQVRSSLILRDDYADLLSSSGSPLVCQFET